MRISKKMFVFAFLFSFLFFLISPVSFSSAQGDNSNSFSKQLQLKTSGINELQGKLVFSHILFRHGDRTPVEPYPTDPWKDESAWPTGFGQLTNIGKNQHYQLGKWFRKRYSSLLNVTDYSKNIIYVQSTDVDRTLMSAESNLAGLFPPQNKQIWNQDIKWQPVPIHTIPEKLDYVLAAKKYCPAYEEEMAEVRNSQEFINIDNKLADLYEYLSDHSGKKINTIEGVQKINNTLQIEVIYNKTLPSWTRKVFPSEEMTYAADFAFQVPTYNRKLARLKTGPLLKEILKRFSDKSRQKLKSNRSLWMYSAHDTTVGNLLNTLNLFKIHSPPYAATILMEMRMYNKTPLISVFYKTTIEEPKPLEIPNCGIQCPLAKMYELYGDVIPDNWDSECDLNTPFSAYLISDKENRNFAVNVLTIVVFIVLLSAIIYLGTVYFRRRSYFRVLVY